VTIWHATHNGHYITGHSIIVAESEDEARALLEIEMKVHGISEPHVWDMRRLNTNEPKCFVISDGDY
jgi:hypothetical protein